MKYPHLLFLLLLAVSCGNHAYTNKPSANPPSMELVKFCSEFVSKNWDTDSSRLIKKGLYGELDYASIQRFDQQSFYKIPFENSQISRFLKSESHPEKRNLFEKAKSIWGFFYFKKTGEMFSDGVIEQWEFHSNKDAKEAMNAIKNAGDEIFFNTQPYFCVVENKLYAFHTRAMAFSYDQKPVFEEFVKRNKAVI